jgi:hypothetical protein
MRIVAERPQRPQAFSLLLPSSIDNPEATTDSSQFCIPRGWMLKYFEISTA